jgi:hypothetical protein
MRSVRTLAEILCLWERELTSHGYINSGHYVADKRRRRALAPAFLHRPTMWSWRAAMLNALFSIH